MGRIRFFNFISLNGFYKGLNEDISWNKHGTEENEFSAESMGFGDTLLFGRVTYELMENYWSTPDAFKNDPIVAEGMYKADKIVFSRTLQSVSWNKTIVRNDLEETVTELKNIPGKNYTILGSGSIITQLAEQGLIDEFQIMIYPVVIGQGTPIFNDIKNLLNLRLISTKDL